MVSRNRPGSDGSGHCYPPGKEAQVPEKAGEFVEMPLTSEAGKTRKLGGREPREARGRPDVWLQLVGGPGPARLPQRRRSLLWTWRPRPRGQECPNPATQPAVPPAQTKGHRSRDCPPPRKCLWLAGGPGVPSGSQRKEARPGPGEVLQVTPDVAGEPGKCLVDTGAMYSVLT